MKAFVVYPHQLYELSKVNSILTVEKVSFSDFDYVFLVEEYLYFKQFNFHPLKIKFHIESMFNYKLELDYFFKKNNIKTKIIYIKSQDLNSAEDVIRVTKKYYNIENLFIFNPTDDWLLKKVKKECKNLNLDLHVLESPNFIFTESEIKNFFSPDKNGKQKFFMNSFYIFARKKLNILIEDGEPAGGKWSYDAENRKKIPKGESLPDEEGFKWENTREGAEKVLDIFLKERFFNFGDYEDAIVHDKNFLYHSTISPYLNVGLLDPKEVVEKAIKYYEESKNKLDINKLNPDKIIMLATLEGFVRQVIGWREYMRAVYILKGVEIRNKNFFTNGEKSKNKLPYTFWTGETGNLVVDATIKKTIKYAYNHHIERLMILGNYMLLKEYNTDDIYKWFMEMYIDAYDWVMVPNVYSMSQYADGGLITTKPYVSGSAYILKMSDYKKDTKSSNSWDKEWDNLYWNFIYKNREIFKNNFRMSMMVNMAIKRFEK